MKYRSNFLLVVSIAFSFTVNAQTGVWPNVTKEMKPWTRWWWMGSAVDEKNIAQALKQYQQVGFGGVEITPIYGAKGFESKYIPFLSPQWLQMLKFSVEKAQAKGMGVDMNLGTGWPFGGPQVSPAEAATKMIVQRYTLKRKEKLVEKIVVKEAKQPDAKLQALRAIAPDGKQTDLIPFLSEDGTLNWSPSTESVDIIAFFAGKTRQAVKRAAPGGEGFTLDHLDKKSVGVYLDRFHRAFSGQQPGVRAFFNDSYEVYGANWTSQFFQEFKNQKGYNLEDYLLQLTDKNPENEQVARIKSDYREVMSNLLQRNFLDEFTGFSKKYNAVSKNQAHGSPGNLIDLYAATDIAECETFGSSFFPIPGLRRDKEDVRNVDPDPMMFKFATSATNTHGKKLTSSETFTWLTEHFKTSLAQAKPEVEQLFLSGVNHVFYHGTTYSPEEVGYPGWLFYASVNFVPSNSFWPHLKGLNEYITRVQSVLQSTKADNEILMYWPIYDVWNNPKGLDMALKVHDVDDWLHSTEFYKQSVVLSNQGYSFDFCTDNIIANSKVVGGNISTHYNATAYKTLLIPESHLMSEVTLENIINLAQNGAKIIFQSLPKDVPGLANLEARRVKFTQLINSLDFKSEGSVQKYRIGNGEIIVSADFAKALSAIAISREELTDKGLKFIRRIENGNVYYYVVNHSKDDVNTFVKLNSQGNQVILMDPDNGHAGEAEVNGAQVKLQIKSGQALIVKVAKERLAIEKWRYLNQQLASTNIEKPWNLTFTNGGPELPTARKLTELKSWTAFGDEKANKFAGSGVYETTFKFSPKPQHEYVLDLGKVAESARVWVNGQEVGIVWGIPFEARIGKYLKKGKNTLKIEVNNLMANRIKDLDQRGIEWRNYHEINFVNIDYKAFNAKDWKLMPSGLLGPVVIKTYQ